MALWLYSRSFDLGSRRPGEVHKGLSLGRLLRIELESWGIWCISSMHGFLGHDLVAGGCLSSYSSRAVPDS